MMRMFAIGLLLICGTVHAQIVAESIEKVCVIETAEGFEANGSLWMVPADAKLTKVPAARVKLSGLTDFQVSATASDKDRNPLTLRSIGPSTWLVSGAPRVWLNITAIDFERKLFETAVIEVEVSETKPEPEPDETEPNDDKQSDGDTVPLVAKAVVFVEETMDRAKHPEKTTAMLDAQLWQTLKDMGLDIQVVDDDEPDPRWRKIIDQVTPRPAMVIVESPDSIRVFEVPETADEIESTIRGNIVR